MGPAIFRSVKLRPFGSVSTSKSDFYDSTIFRDFLAEILFFQFLTVLLKEISIWPPQAASADAQFSYARPFLTPLGSSTSCDIKIAGDPPPKSRRDFHSPIVMSARDPPLIENGAIFAIQGT